MLKKENRLSTNFEFNITKKYGTHYEGKYFHVYILTPKNYLGSSKFGIVVSNKYSKIAVRRNRIKRLLRETIKTNLESFKDNLWIVVYPKKNVSGKTYEEINSDFNKTLQKVFIPH